MGMYPREDRTSVRGSGKTGTREFSGIVVVVVVVTTVR